ncbi:MAG: chromosome segregation protein SMC [Methanoregulaceae archaeon]
MFISELEIDNFKSFSGKTRIPFSRGFTVISGPNGSGKSNIIDAILFVLGLSSSHSLRAEKLTDLINISSHRSTAEVALRFSDGTRIRRRIKRTENGYYSYFYMNDRLSKQSEVADYLGRLGVRPHGYNVVMQGDITRIIEMSDLDRRRVIDEIAGVAEFDLRRNQAFAELEVVKERIEREELLLREASRRLEELSVEREQALVHKQLTEELAAYEDCRAAAELAEKEKERTALLSLIEEHRLDAARLDGDRSHQAHELSYLQGDLAALDEEIHRRSGSEYLKLLSQLEEAKGVIKASRLSIDAYRREREENLQAVNRAFADTRRTEEKITAAQTQVRNLSIDRTNLAMEQAQVQSRLRTIEGRLQAGQAETAEAQAELFRLLAALEELTGRRAELLRRQDQLIEESRSRTRERERLGTRRSELNAAIISDTAALDEARASQQAHGEERRRIEASLSVVERDLLRARSEFEALRLSQRANEQALMRCEAQQQVQGDAGGRALEAVLGMDGVHGTIASLGRVPPDFMEALNTAAGSRLNNVVVDDDRVASEAIAYLKETRAGRLTFLPLNRLREVPRPPVSGDGIVDYAVNLVRFDPVYERAFGLVFGATLVMETLSLARRLLGKHRMVTLEGELLEKTGAMTGGYQKRSVRGFAASVEDEVRRLLAALAEQEEESKRIETTVGRLSGESDTLREARSRADQEAARCGVLVEEYERRLAASAAELEEMARSEDALGGEGQDGVVERAGIEQALNDVQDEVQKTNRRVASLRKELEETEIPELTDQRERARAELEEVERRLRNKESDIADAQRERIYFSRRIEELGEERGRLEAKNRHLEEETAQAEVQIAASEEEIHALELRQQTFSAELEELRRRRASMQEGIQQFERALLDLESRLERTRFQMEVCIGREQSLITECAVLKERVGDRTTTLSLAEIDEGIATTELALRRLGAVNMLAVEEYDRVAERVAGRAEMVEVLSRERGTLLERIAHFEAQKLEAFLEAYTAINENFCRIFATLTSGNGRLVLECEDDPFEGGLTFAVQPRDKAVHLLNALSGGEKSLTTLAFIFSIQQYMPAPFYAFDEVDMSLDGSNVERIASMVREIASESQFVIVSLRKPMIDSADRVVGVTVRPDKSTLVTGVRTGD